MYIEREAIRREAERSMHDNPHTDGIVRRTHTHEHQHFLRMIEDTPAADVIPVVRCKDCENWTEHDDDTGGAFCFKWGDATSPEDFCSRGKGKTDGVSRVARGEWIDQYGGKYANALYKCSACGAKALCNPYTMNWELSDFCPTCGTKMIARKEQ